MNRIAKQILKIAKQLIADTDYIYDPDHKKRPAGGYHKTEKGWSKLEQKKESVKPVNKPVKRVENMSYDEKASLVYNYKPTSSKTLDQIVQSSPYDYQWMLRLNVAKHPNTSSDTLDKLSEDKNDNVRMQCLKHKNLSKKTMKKLMKDKNKHIQYAASRRYNYGEKPF